MLSNPTLKDTSTCMSPLQKLKFERVWPFLISSPSSEVQLPPPALPRPFHTGPQASRRRNDSRFRNVLGFGRFSLESGSGSFLSSLRQVRSTKSCPFSMSTSTPPFPTNPRHIGTEQTSTFPRTFNIPSISSSYSSLRHLPRQAQVSRVPLPLSRLCLHLPSHLERTSHPSLSKRTSPPNSPSSLQPSPPLHASTPANAAREDL